MHLAWIGMLSLCALFALMIAIFFVVGVACKPVVHRRKMQRLRSALEFVTSEFNRQGVDYWIDFGTALGHYRERDIIPHDQDIDIGITEHEEHKVVSSVLPVLATYYHVVKRDSLYQLYLKTNTNIACDIYVYRFSETYLTYGKVVSSIDTILPTRESMFRDSFQVRVVANEPQALIDRYGDTYMIPRPHFKGVDTDSGYQLPPLLAEYVSVWRDTLGIQKPVHADLEEK